MKLRLRGHLAPLTAGLVAAAVVMSGVPAIADAPTPLLGGLTLNQSTGLDASELTATSAGPCPAQTTNLLVRITGAGFPSDGQNVVPNSKKSIFAKNPATGGYRLPFQDTLQSFAAQQTPPATLGGKYDFTIYCLPDLGTADYGRFVGSIWFTDATHWQDTDPTPTTVATSVTLGAAPVGPIAAGAAVTLNATVAPAVATGSVNFLDGTTVIGTAPVSAAHAALVTSALAVGVHSLTAVFTPSGPAGATSSTSAALPFTVSQPAPVIASASALMVPVGTVLGCPGGGKLTAAASQLGQKLSCGASGPAVTIGEGAPLKALVLPSLAGTGKVGAKLTLRPGVWAPAATSRTVVWKRDGKVIAKQHAATYVVKKTDSGHKISATVIAHRAGYADGTANTAPAKAKAFAAVAARGSLGASATATATDVSAMLSLPVGTMVACVTAVTSAATTVSSAWLLDGSVYSTRAVITIADTLVGRTLTCRTTAVNAGGVTTSDAVVTVGRGAALVNYLKPRVVGLAKVGKKLSAVAGKWNPVFGKAAFVWLRNGKAIKGATKATYVAAKGDKKGKISVRVTVSRIGWASGTATSAAVSVG